MKFKYPILEIEFDRPRSGYWDFGKKSGGTFEPEIITPSMSRCDVKERGFPKKGTIRWGSWELNFWFNAGAGRSWKEAASIAKRKLENTLNVPATITINWKVDEKW